MKRSELSPIQRGILLTVLEDAGRVATESLYDYVEERRPTSDEDGEPYETSREEIGALEGAGLLDQDGDGTAAMGYSSLTDAGRDLAGQLRE